MKPALTGALTLLCLHGQICAAPFEKHITGEWECETDGLLYGWRAPPSGNGNVSTENRKFSFTFALIRCADYYDKTMSCNNEQILGTISHVHGDSPWGPPPNRLLDSNIYFYTGRRGVTAITVYEYPDIYLEMERDYNNVWVFATSTLTVVSQEEDDDFRLDNSGIPLVPGSSGYSYAGTCFKTE